MCCFLDEPPVMHCPSIKLNDTVILLISDKIYVIAIKTPAIVMNRNEFNDIYGRGFTCAGIQPPARCIPYKARGLAGELISSLVSHGK